MIIILSYHDDISPSTSARVLSLALTVVLRKPSTYTWYLPSKYINISKIYPIIPRIPSTYIYYKF